MLFLSVYQISYFSLDITWIFPLVSVTLFFRRAIVAVFSTEQIYKTLSKTDFILQLVNWITDNNH